MQLDAQMRAVILGTALMLVLHEVYPDIRNALAASLLRIEPDETLHSTLGLA
ncbi:unnamed protein product [Gongylonema pulchrum]|nr:unnamed protein product [Gongylonema pulchrum]